MDPGNIGEEIDTNHSSVRRKYKKGRFASSNINYGVVLKHVKKDFFSSQEENPIIKEEKITITEKPIHNRGIVAPPVETESKTIKTKTVIKKEDDGKSNKKLPITKTEINENKNTENKARNFFRNKDKDGNRVSNSKNIEKNT